MENTKTCNWNVISEDEFKSRITNVFDLVSKSLSKTLGPYGSTTIIEKYGEMHITKDGWQVLKNIRFDNPTENNILMLLLRISAQVVIRVGDGSTSSIVAADAILKELEKSTIIKTLRPKDIMKVLTMCVDVIVHYIYNESTKIDVKSLDEIYRLAYVSTNGDEEIANIIQEIYKLTNNPSIEYLSSKTNKTFYEIVDGYRGNITYVDNIFVTNDDNTCVVENPYILMFDHKVDVDTSRPIIQFALNKAVDDNKRLVVIAPHYDKYLLDDIRKSITTEFRVRGTSSVVYARANIMSNLSRELYNDFAVLCGAQVISEQFVYEIKEENIDEYIGSVNQMVIGDKTTLIKGFIKRNETMYKKIVDDATIKYNNALKDNELKGIVDIKLNEMKQRMTKLRCNMGIIHVGGNSELEKAANFDLVEDAVKACESAFTYGYNIGGSLVIAKVIDELVETPELEPIKYVYNDTVVNEVMSIIKQAFLNVYKTVLSNKYNADGDSLVVENIISDTINVHKYTKVYNLINNEYSSEIINSCETDIEILKAAISIISLLMSSNQYISIETQNKE